mgnify:CR=1 FL=1
MARLRWGIKTAPQHTTYEAMLDVWQEADRTPVFEHAWLFDHFNPIQGSLDGPCFEGWTLLSALAAQTERVRLGLMVAGNTYRHPAVHAHMAATVDVISGGRLDFGVGAGWNEYEHESMGIPLYAPGERIRRLGEACEITKRLWTQHLTDFDGRYYQLQEARLEPKPIQKPYPPIVIGGSGEQLASALRKQIETSAVAVVDRLAALDRAAIRKQFEARFTARRMALDYLAAYRSLMEQAGPRIKLVSSAE